MIGMMGVRHGAARWVTGRSAAILVAALTTVAVAMPGAAAADPPLAPSDAARLCAVVARTGAEASARVAGGGWSLACRRPHGAATQRRITADSADTLRALAAVLAGLDGGR